MIPNIIINIIINSILNILMTKIMKTQVRIPYRDSALTMLLQNALGGNSKTIMVLSLSLSSHYLKSLAIDQTHLNIAFSSPHYNYRKLI